MSEHELTLFLRPETIKPPAEHGSELTRRIALNHAGRLIAVGMQDKSIRLYDATNFEEIQKLQDNFLSTALAFSPRGDTVASGGVDRVVKIWDIRTGEVLTTLEGHTYPILGLSFSPDGSRLLSASGDTTLIVWDLNSGTESSRLRGHKLYVMSCDWHPEDDLVVSGAVDATIALWDPNTGKMLGQYGEHRTAVHVVRFSPQGDRLLSTSSDMTCKVWDVGGESVRPVHTLQGHTAEVRTATWSSDGELIASGSSEKELFLWSLDSLQVEGEARTAGEIDGIEWFPSKKEFVTADSSGAITRWRVQELSIVLAPFRDLLAEIQADSTGAHREEHIRQFDDLVQRYGEETLKDKRVFYLMWQCKRALGLLKGRPAGTR